MSQQQDATWTMTLILFDWGVNQEAGELCLAQGSLVVSWLAPGELLMASKWTILFMLNSRKDQPSAKTSK